MPRRETPKPCDGCGEKPRERGPGRRYCSDCSIGCDKHGAQHSCGQCVRGLLCGNCNIALGMMKDDPARLRSAARYLEED